MEKVVENRYVPKTFQYFVKEDELANEASLWYESPKQIAQGLAWGRKKATLLAWIQFQFAISLTEKETATMKLYFFQGLTMREIADVQGNNASSVLRSTRRAINKLKWAAAESPEIERILGKEAALNLARRISLDGSKRPRGRCKRSSKLLDAHDDLLVRR